MYYSVLPIFHFEPIKIGTIYETLDASGWATAYILHWRR